MTTNSWITEINQWIIDKDWQGNSGETPLAYPIRTLKSLSVHVGYCKDIITHSAADWNKFGHFKETSSVRNLGQTGL